MKSEKMPTTIVLLFFSWLIASLGCLAGVAVLVIYGLNKANSIISCILIVSGGLFLSILVRMVANIGQMLFDVNSSLQEIKTFFNKVEGQLDMDKKKV